MQISKATQSVLRTPAQEQSDYFRKYCTDDPLCAQLLYPRMSPRNMLVSSFLHSTLARVKQFNFFFFHFAGQIHRMNVERGGWLSCWSSFCQNACFLSAACHSIFSMSRHRLGWDYFWLCINPYFTLERVLRSAGWAVYECKLRNISPSKTQLLNDQG